MGRESSDDDVEFVMPDDKLRSLARLVHLQEAQRISTIQFQSVYHRAQYLRDSRETYDLAVGILDSGHKLNIKHQDDEVTSPLAHKVYIFSKSTVGKACRTLWNINLRNSYLQKIRAYAQEKEQQITKLCSNEALSLEEKVNSAQGIVEELALHKNLAYDFMMSRQNPTSLYTNYLLGRIRRSKLAATTFDHMVYKYQAKLAKKDPSFTGRFEDLGLPKGEVIELEDLGSAGLLKKAEVYEEIVKSSGRGTHNTLVKVGKGAGAALILFQLGMIAWDTYSSDHPFQTLAKDSMETAASLGGGVFGEIIGSAVATSIVASAGVVMTTAATVFVLVTSVVGGIVGGMVVGAIAGWFLDKLFKTGGKEAHKHVDRHSAHKLVDRHPTTENLVVHVAPMPDGDRLARQITAVSN